MRYLERGSDDVLAKPYSYTELRARIGALLRRARHAASGRLVRIGALRIDLAAREVWLDGDRVSLTAKEYDLLRCLAARADAGVHAAGAAARRMGLLERVAVAHRGQPRGAAPAEARPAWRAAAANQRLGHRLAPRGPAGTRRSA